jgi:hypothetical protein
MLPTDFAKSKAKHPQMTGVFEAIERWIRENRRLKFIEFNRLLQTYPQLDPVAAAVALSLLVDDGVLDQALAVEAPTNHALALADDLSTTGLYKCEADIPDELYDSDMTAFETDDGELVPVYQEASHD